MGAEHIERTSLTLDKIIQFIHLVLHNYMLWCSWGLRNWLHNKAVARKNLGGEGGGGGGGGGTCPCTVLFCKVTSICFVLSWL